VSTPEFREWPKIPRWDRPAVITEKIDGTNACVVVTAGGEIHAQSRKRIITPESDNFGFAAWVQEYAEELATLGEGYHYGEWYGSGIQRGYGLDHKRFALFNADRWADSQPDCCDVVPVLWRGQMGSAAVWVDECLSDLRGAGSVLAPGFDKPEGVVLYHQAARISFKALLENDHLPKGLAA